MLKSTMNMKQKSSYILRLSKYIQCLNLGIDFNKTT